MSEERVQRRLAAVLAADVVGYSRLMGLDEEGTLGRIKSIRRELIDPKVAEHRGRIVKTSGDGALVEFASAVDAMRCALEVQQAMAARDAEMPDDRRIAFRIGINVGDIIIDEDDIYGDGVNVAARLETLAPPGGICVSRGVRDQVRDRIACAFEDMGQQSVKNIARPIRVFRVLRAGARAPEAAAAPSERPSIVVLAFANMSGDAEQEYFSDGIAEDIITDLSKLSGLLVIARNSAFAYKGRSVDLREVSRDLGVRYVLEGSVRKAGNRVRVTAQLIDGTTGGHLWAERYDRDLSDIFAVQDELTREIVGALSLKLTREEDRRLAHKGTQSLEAYDRYMRGRDYFWRHTRDSVTAAKLELEAALALDPSFALPHAYLSMCLNVDYTNEWGGAPDEVLRDAEAHAREAAALDPGEAQSYFALAGALLWRRDHDAALAAAERSVELDPNFAGGYTMMGWVLHYMGRSADAIARFEQATRLDPHFPDINLHFLAQAQLHLQRYEEAAATARRRIDVNPTTDISRVLLAAALGHLGQAEAARAAWAEALRVNPRYSLAHRRRTLPYKDPAAFEHMVEGLRKAGIEA